MTTTAASLGPAVDGLLAESERRTSTQPSSPDRPSTPDGLLTPEGLARRDFATMGTTVSVVLPADRIAEAVAVEGVFRDWHRICTRFDPDSELSRLNAAAGHRHEVGALLFEVIAAARRAAEATDGLFDPTLLGTLEAIGYDRDFAGLTGVGGAPAHRSRSALTPSTGGWRELELDPEWHTVRLPEGTGLDLGGLAKGMAVDAAIALLADRGVATAAVDAGGDLAVRGLPAGASSWPIAVDAPNASHRLSLVRGALATSSVARRRWRQGPLERHHLIDPRTGSPSATPLWSVSVAAPTCAQAEVAAKVAFLLGPSDGGRFLAERDLSGFFVLPDGRAEPAGLVAA